MKLAIVAGETSGDLLGAGLIRCLRERYPGIEVEGIGGDRMQAEGCVSLFPMERLSVMGLVETLGRLRELIGIRSRLIRRWLDEPPVLFVGVDAPDFNLALANRLRKAGIKTAHYVSPSVWAWRRYRVKKIVNALDLIMVLFPFESAFYEGHAMPVKFVGHPLADAIPDRVSKSEARDQLGLEPGAELVALLPGSRHTEMRLLGDMLVKTAEWLLAERPQLRFVAPMVNAGLRRSFETMLANSSIAAAIDLVDGDARTAMAASDVVLLASGTATLEAMLLKRPMVVTYRINPVTYALVHRVIASNISSVGLPNLLAGKALVPELLQADATPEALGRAVQEFLQHPERVAALEREFQTLHEQLRCDASRSAAAAVAGLLEQRP